MEELEFKKHPITGELVPEVWKEIEGYDGWYEVSNYGRVKSYKAGGPRKTFSETPRILKLKCRNDGYVDISLSRNNNRKTCSVHRLVAEAFIPNPENKPEVNHLDCNRANNFYLNLKWSTPKENVAHSILKGDRNVAEENNPNSKLSKEDVLKIRRKYNQGGTTYIDLADMYGVTKGQIGHIINKRVWAHV